MKQIYLFLSLLLMALAPTSVTAQQKIDYVDEYGTNQGKGVEIDGVIWAPVNVGYHKTNYRFGKLYQWGRKQGQGYTDPMDFPGSVYSDPVVVKIKDAPAPSMEAARSKANANIFYQHPSGYYFDWFPYDHERWRKVNADGKTLSPNTINDPSPKGWRVATREEVEKLLEHTSEWTTNEEGIPGIWASGSVPVDQAGDAKIFLPAIGYRGSDALAVGRGWMGRYWTADHSGTAYGAYLFEIGEKGAGVLKLPQYGDNAFGVRSVQK